MDVSKLIAELNLVASCRVERRACDAGSGAAREAGVRGAVSAIAACTGRTRLKAVGVRARAERTLNMFFMLVTLDVSRLSGWLNWYEDC